MRNKKIPTLDPSILGISRREMLSRFGAGFGTFGLQQMLSQTASADAPRPLRHCSRKPPLRSESQTYYPTIYAGGQVRSIRLTQTSHRK